MGPVFDPEDRGKNELYEVADTKELCVCVCVVLSLLCLLLGKLLTDNYSL